jgi:hypothetical protein
MHFAYHDDIWIEIHAYFLFLSSILGLQI